MQDTHVMKHRLYTGVSIETDRDRFEFKVADPYNCEAGSIFSLDPRSTW